MGNINQCTDKTSVTLNRKTDEINIHKTLEKPGIGTTPKHIPMPKVIDNFLGFFDLISSLKKSNLSFLYALFN